MDRMKALIVILFLCTASLFAASANAASVRDLAIHSTVAGEGRTIIFVHGWTCDETSWSEQVPEFMQDYRVVTLDLPGHGKSEAPAQSEFSMDLFAAAIEAVREELGADRVVLVGHSMGAVAIRQYALEYPEHVAGLVSVDGLLDVRPFGSLTMPEATLEWRTAVIESMFVPETSDALRAKIRRMMLATPEATAIGANKTILDPAIQSDRTIEAKALTVWSGTRDLAALQSTREMLPNWESAQLPGTGHFVMMEKPGEFNALLRSFLEQRAEF